MTEKDFKAEIKNGLSGGYLLYGEEEYLKEYYLDRAVEAVIGNSDFAEFNLIKTDEDNYSSSALADALASFPMMSEKVCVVCRVRLSTLSDKELDSLCQVLSTLPDRPAVLFVSAPSGYFDAGSIRKNRPSAMYKKLSEYLTPVEFPHQTPAMLKKWALRHFEAEKISAEDTALETLCELCDYDMTVLGGECEKLICFAKACGQETITAQTVRELCSEYGEAGAFALSNAIVSGDKQAALRALKEYKDKRRSAVMVLSGIISDFSNMLKVSVYMKNGMYKIDIARKTGIHEFRVGRYMEAVKNTEPSAVRAVLERCREADTALKSSGIDYIALERLVCTMSAKARLRTAR